MLSLSRAAVLRSLAGAALLAYLCAAFVLLIAVAPLGHGYAWAARGLIVFGASFGAMLVLPHGRTRSRLRLLIAQHLFSHRYDYRNEWLRFSQTLGDGDAPLAHRIERALADIADAPAARLLVMVSSGRLEPAGSGEWPTQAGQGFDPVFARMLEARPHILEGDAIRAHHPSPSALEEEPRAIPDWVRSDESIWAGVPLVHGDRIAGLVLLERPRAGRRVDWEDHDLLSVAGRQVASHLAEAQGQEALAQARRFHEFNRRFAFIVHDVKNLASQLGLVARNAERHADNPAFRADMVETLKDSVARLDGLLQRLSPQGSMRADPPRAARPAEILMEIADRLRSQHPIRVMGPTDIVAQFDPTRLETAIGHLVQNAIEASPPDEAVWLSIQQKGQHVEIAVTDRGRGMSSDFVRHGLFVPFNTTKPGGFGIGAFEARSLINAMGGRLEVDSHEAEGSRFSILLPCVESRSMRLSA